MARYWMAGLSVAGVMALAAIAVMFVNSKTAEAHCQVPCGIYDDSARIARLHEDAATIAKAVVQIKALGGKHDVTSINQVIRWINTKEIHASHIIEVVSQYFLTQKVKPKAAGSGDYNAYLASLADHHAVMVAAMKTKQTVDAGVVDKLSHAIDALATHYKK